MVTKLKHCGTGICMSFLLLCYCPPGMQAQKKQKVSSFYSKKGNNDLLRENLDSAEYLSGRAPVRAIDKINKAIELSIRGNDENSETLCYLALGNIEQGLSQHELAIENYKKCIARLSFEKKGGKGRITPGNIESSNTLFNAYKQMAVSYLQLNRTTEAYAAITVCSEVRFKFVSENEKLDAKRTEAEILARVGKPDDALQILESTLDAEKKSGNTDGEIKTLLCTGNHYRQQKNETKTLEYYSQAKNLAEKYRKDELLLTANNLMAQVFRQQKNVDKEIEARNNSIALSNSSPKQQRQFETQNKEIGNAYLNNNEIQKAIPFFEKSLVMTKQGKMVVPHDLFGKSNDLEGMANTYKLLAREYLKMGDTERALAYLEIFVEVQDSIRSIRGRELDEALQLSNQLGKNQQRIELLEKERNLSERSIQILKQDQDLKEDELYTRNVIIGSLCFLLLFMVGGGYYILRSSREKRRVNQQLAIRSLRGQMNPHFIFNALNSVNHYISQSDERAANKYLSDFSKLMRSVMETSKHDLITLAEEIEILKLYLQLEHSRFRDDFDYTFEVAEGIDVSEFELPPMIIQPFIENAVWHGLRYTEGKGQLHITIEKAAGGLIITITDNGIGRKKSLEIKTKNQKLQNSTGMQNIENRIRIMNELFRTNIRADVNDAFENAVHPGTRVKLFIPQKINKHA